MSVSKFRVLSSANSSSQGAKIMHGLVILPQNTTALNRNEWKKVVWGPQISLYVQS